jgi:hypothetical protein
MSSFSNDDERAEEYFTTEGRFMLKAFASFLKSKSRMTEIRFSILASVSKLSLLPICLNSQPHFSGSSLFKERAMPDRSVL